ncbi:MAG: exodeoxyribonuclease VII large subunit [Muribaculaceae bacterium]|nr:exodeoxyribonuclease VII large subunit [Muribaculaceae bacterium]
MDTDHEMTDSPTLTIAGLDEQKSMSLLELNQLIGSLIMTPATQRQWVTAELSDVSPRRNSHCYMELIQKDDGGVQLAKARAVIWGNLYPTLSRKFEAATGQAFATGLKVMVCVSASMHPVYGLSLVITDINPAYTMGDHLRRRREIIARLASEGILECNRSLQLSDVPQRIAVISAPQAAGYGDFVNQILHNPYRLLFKPKLFPATMQGTQTAQSIIRALDEIAAQQDEWDCVVIIRGGGATSDLQGFEDYDLAANICNFPLPVIVGIGHERDTTLLDYVAYKPVKTPTAAAEWLIAVGRSALDRLNERSQRILQIVSERIAAQKEQLSYYSGILPMAPLNASRKHAERLNKAILILTDISGRRIAPAVRALDIAVSNLRTSAQNAVVRQKDRITAKEQLLSALSPQSVLNRGFSITRANGITVTDASALTPGTQIETTLAKGTITSVIN